MTRKAERGKPIEELTKGSYEYTLHTIRTAFYRQFPRQENDYFWVEEVFVDHLIVEHEQLPRDEFFFVPYTRQDGGYLFANRDEWEVVELTYSPVQAMAERDQGAKEIVEKFICELVEADQTNEAGPWRVRGVGATAEAVNRNGRRRKRHVVEEAVRAVKKKMAETGIKGRMVLTGESDHPQDKGKRAPLWGDIIVIWDTIDFDGEHVLIEGNLLPTREGRDSYIRMQAGAKPDISQRSWGRSVYIDENGQTIEEVLEEDIRGYDFVNGGADSNAFVEFSESSKKRPSGPPITKPKEEPMDLEKLRQEYPELVAKIEAEQDEKQRKLLEKQLEMRAAEDARIAEAVRGREAQIRAALGLADSDDLIAAMRTNGQRLAELEEADRAKEAELQRFREAQQRQQVADHITQAAEGLKYPAEVKAAFVESLLGLQPATIEEADALFTLKQQEYDKLMANAELTKRGKGGSDIEIKGPVFESETGLPAYLQPAHEFTERMIERDVAKRRNLAEAKTRGELFTRRYLEAYDQAYKRHLIAEYNEFDQFDEALATSDLNLPYSVSRAIVAEAVPELVALSMFDFGLAETSPTLIYFENYSGESGSAPTVTDESFTSAHNAWVNLANNRLRPGTVTVTSSPAGTGYDEYTDYVIDYASGKIMVLSSGDMANATAFLIDYTYDAVRTGEGGSIQRGKGTLSSQTITLEADRLATLINDEAVVFAQTQIGWDAQAKTVQMLIREIREMIDSGIIRLALASAIRAANSGGTWTSASETVDKLVEKIGLAKVAIMNDNYTPTFILASFTNAERLSNWANGLYRDGSPDAELNAAGFVRRIKGLPLYQSNQVPDTHIIVGHPELVQYRVLSTRPMTLKGPFPAYDANGKLIASSQWYVEEYNQTVSLIAEKGGYVTVA